MPVHRLAIDFERDAAHDQQIETRGGNDNVGFDFFSGRGAHPLFGKGLQGIRYHGQFAIDRGFEYIGLRTKCEPLLPGSIPGYEVGLELEVVAHITADLVSQHLNHRLGIRL